MPAEDKEEGRSFKVEDRRRFSETGEARSGTPNDEETTPPPSESARPQASQAAASDLQSDFASFVIGLTTQALIHLGVVSPPEGGEPRVDLDAARQFIDILAMLRKKTEGNLDSAETALLENALYDLRMRFVEHKRKSSS